MLEQVQIKTIGNIEIFLRELILNSNDILDKIRYKFLMKSFKFDKELYVKIILSKHHCMLSLFTSIDL